MTLKAGRHADIPVSMCGEMASDPMYTRLLLGMGLSYFSVPATTLLEIKSIINEADLSKLQTDIQSIMCLHHHSDIARAVNKINQLDYKSPLKLHA